MCDQKTIAQIMSEKIALLGMKKITAVRKVAKACECTEVAVYCWLNGVNRPQRKYLQGISDCLNIRLSRLQYAWKITAVAAKAKPKLTATVNDPYKENHKYEFTFVPSKDDVYLLTAIELIKLGKEKRSLVMGYVDTLEQHFGTKES